MNIQKLQSIIQQFETYCDLNGPLPLDQNTNNWKWEGKDYPRIRSLQEFKEIILMIPNTIKNVLTFNGAQDPEIEILKNFGCVDNHIDIDYESNPEKHDLHNLSLDDKLLNSFDLVLLNQTIEHLYDPILCLKNILPYIRKGGYIYVNAPSNNIPHGEPHHFYTGFTPLGMGAILEAAGYNCIVIGYWGNSAYTDFIFKYNTWPDYRQLPQNMENQKTCPCIVWGWGVKS